MPSWNTRGLRGSVLEEALNITNEKYRQEKLALVQKIPTPITPMEFDKQKGQITLAYFDQKSTVDYIGNVQGVPVCFDAKECAVDTFPIKNIHEHQIAFMREFEGQDGIAFLLVCFSAVQEYYYVPFCDVMTFWERAENGGRKSFCRAELDPSFQILCSGQVYIHYLDALAKDLKNRETKKRDGTKKNNNI